MKKGESNRQLQLCEQFCSSLYLLLHLLDNIIMQRGLVFVQNDILGVNKLFATALYSVGSIRRSNVNSARRGLGPGVRIR